MMHEGAKPILFQRAQKLRKRETEAERILWEKLSNKQLGVKFRRQHPLYRFIVDFYCHELRAEPKHVNTQTLKHDIFVLRIVVSTLVPVLYAEERIMI